MWNGDAGITVMLPNFSQTSISPTWIKASETSIVWKSKPLSDSDKPTFWWAFEEASVLGASIVLDNLPVPFCWKQHPGGRTPGCKGDNWTRHEAMCYEDCRDGYSGPVLGVCYERCRSGYRDDGLTCFKRKSVLNFYWKKSYVTKQATLLGDRAGCDDGWYKQGGECYQHCSEISFGLVNCGIGACSYDSGACIEEIGDMTLSVAKGVFQAVTFVASYGEIYSASKLMQLGREPFMKASPKMMEVARKTWHKTVEAFTDGNWLDELRGNVKHGIQTRFENEGKQEYIDILNEHKAWDTVANRVVDNYQRQITEAHRMSDNIGTNLYSTLGVTQVYQNCKNMEIDDNGNVHGTTNDAIACANAAMGFINTFDWTGLTTIAMAFLKPQC